MDPLLKWRDPMERILFPHIHGNNIVPLPRIALVESAQDPYKLFLSTAGWLLENEVFAKTSP
jgi:hypothetical protein